MTKKTYYQQFCDDYKITDENNTIKLFTRWAHSRRKVEVENKIFTEDPQGNLEILVYTLDRELILYDNPKSNPEKDNINNLRDMVYKVTRYKEPKIYTDEKTNEQKEKKYNFPKGAGTYPFMPPSLVSKYEQQAEIKTLVLTEGFKKAWLGSMYGLDIIGLSSITHYKQKDTQAMYEGIQRIIRVCKVKNVIFLYDGDCTNISLKALESGKDLYTRPAGFLNSALTVRELLKDLEVDFYFSHVLSENVKGNPKGLDDVFLAAEEEKTAIVNDLLALSRPGNYFYKTNITLDARKLYSHFHFISPEIFYGAHSEWIKEREFVYKGTHYKWKSETNECEVLLPAASKLYFRVGDVFYKYIKIPNKYKQEEKVFHKRNRSTISEDHGEKFIKHIPKYEAFCNVPDHLSYTRIINNCFNLYAEFEHEPEDGDCPTSLAFVKHIFEEHYELGLDYLQLLYSAPTQMLPILCLVSKENATGKSTFGHWLKAIFTQNCTSIGNDDLANPFNAGYASKLVICCEESFIEKKQMVEKIKALSTADKIQMNAKGKDQVEIDFFGKFILFSNNEENFIYATSDDERYWIRKIKKPSNVNVKLLQDLIQEIPCFLHYLNKRKLSTQNEHRAWFNPSLIRTEALKKLIESNRPKIEKDIYTKLRELFIEFGIEKIEMPISYIRETLFKNKYDEYYIRETLEQRFKADRWKNNKGQYESKQVSIPEITWDGKQDYKVIRCRPYVFYRDKFLTNEELEAFAINKDQKATPEQEFLLQQTEVEF